MARTFDFYITSATERLEAGFSSKASQKEAMADVSRAFSMLTDSVRSIILDRRNELSFETQEARSQWSADRGYWDLPSYPHLLRENHLPLFAQIERGEQRAQLCADLRAAIKAAPIAPPAPKADERKAKIIECISDLMARRRAQYVEALEIADRFGGLPVSVNAHYVTNEHNTTFLRYYFYLRGKLTPLSVIMAAADELHHRAKGGAA